MLDLTPADRMFLVQISDGETFVAQSWCQTQIVALVRHGLVRSVDRKRETYQITSAGKLAAKQKLPAARANRQDVPKTAQNEDH